MTKKAPAKKKAKKPYTKNRALAVDERAVKVKAIIDTYVNDRTDKGEFYNIASCCAAHHVPYRTFYMWVQQSAELTELYKKADDLRAGDFKKELLVAGRSSLMKLVKGFQYDEVKQDGNFVKDASTGKPVFVPNGVYTRTTKFQPPSTAAVIYTLNNVDPENFSNRDRLEITGRNGGPINIVRADLDAMSIEQLFFIKHGRLPEEGEI